mgnify:CR=1 FL=1
MFNNYLFNTAVFNQYGYHVVGHAILQSPEYDYTPMVINTVYVIGKDADSNPLYSRATSLVSGESEVFITYADSTVKTQAAADLVSQNILDAIRLTANRGNMKIPTNVGMETFDPIAITDNGGNQSVDKYRVGGYRTIYDGKKMSFQQEVRMVSI